MFLIRNISRTGWIIANGLRPQAVQALKTPRQCRSMRTTSVLFNSKDPSQSGPSAGSATSNNESFDDFRAREERKEHDFETQYRSEQPKTDPDKDEGTGNERISTVEVQILEAALAYVQEHNWSKQALAKGAEAAGLAGAAHGLFDRGGAELIDYFNHKCNQQLVEYMEKLVAENKEPEPPPKFVAMAIEYRLRMLAPYKTNWPQALAIMTLPPNVPTALSSLLTMVDDICYFAGDRSVDFNWYTRRIGLASIFKATELFMLQDSSPDHQRTWKFLEHRIADATKVQDLLSQSGGVSQNLQEAGKSIFDTARNILGLNFNRR